MGKVFVAFLLVPSLLVSLVYAQDTERTFRIKNANATGLQEIATSLRVVAGVQKLSADLKAGTITITGTADQLALADWFVPKLDIVGHSGLGTREYHLHNAKDEVLMVYELEHVANTTGLQEVLTNLRTVGDIQFIYNITEPKVIALRGEPSQVAFAGFLIREFDQTPQPKSSPTMHPFKLSGSGSDMAVVYGLVHALDVSSMQMLITNLRTVIGIKKVYQATAPGMLAIRGTDAEVQMSEWLLSELDRTAPNTDVHEMRMPGGNDDVVHVFYLSHVSDPKTISGLVEDLRAGSQVKKVYFMSQPAALIVRGTADQIALLGKLIALKDQTI